MIPYVYNGIDATAAGDGSKLFKIKNKSIK